MEVGESAEQPKKSRRRRRGGNISRTKKGDKSKRHRQSVPVEAFRGNTPAAAPTVNPPNNQTKSTAEDSARSLRNKLDYEKRKSVRDQKLMAELDEKVQSLEESNLEVEKANRSCTKAAAKIQKEADKNLDLLNSRTDRFTKFAEKKQVEITRVKSQAKRTVLRMTKNLEREQASQFKQARAHSKEISVKDSRIEAVKKESVKAMGKLQSVYEQRVDAME